MLSDLSNSLVSLIYPAECKVCGYEVDDANDGVACSWCWESTRIFSGNEMLCDKCGAFFGSQAAPNPIRCHQCDGHFYEKAAAAGIYEKALAASVLQLKAAPIIAGRVRRALAAGLGRIDLSRINLILPVPLSKQRKLERGYNQADLLAGYVSKLTGIAVDGASLARKTHAPMHRVGMDRRARELTVTNAFEVVRPKLIAGKNILLVDDVFTSGATTSYCAKALKKKGAASVNVLTLARAVMT